MTDFRPQRFQILPTVIKNLIIINVLVWIAQIAFDKQYDLTDTLALWPWGTPYFKPYQIATHMFAHSALDANNQPVTTEGSVKVTRNYWYEIWVDPNGREIKVGGKPREEWELSQG